MQFPGHWRGAPDAIWALADQLKERGVPVLHAKAYPSVGVLVASSDVTVWCYARVLRWQQDGREMTWPAADIYGAARRLAELTQPGTP